MPDNRRRLQTSVIALVSLLTATPQRTHAQVRVEIEPLVGVYTGFSSFPRPPGTGFPTFPDTLTQKTAVALGGQLSVWPGRRVGVRLLGVTAPSKVGPETRDLLNREPVPARVTVVALEAVVPLRHLPSGARVFLAGGPVLISRSGEAYDDFEGLRDLGASLAVGSQFRLSDRLSLQGDIRAVLYSLGLTDPDGLEYPSAFQTDLLAHVGLALTLGTTDDIE
jgi:hypothetical protein